ncbi:hypothetical protein L226DRAFT_210694 [Lentinus tigrinus ALCF2SS1-7]|uniref:uncharacterized protein n=1 Tax=Lentinus tigrinus ALCF2SS1-7 TaxID=1328758 RepID=UPI0011663838|nr:hypothetical protein L226DRAFT_210694 [Lentinus tigrinus ALCF2SS1-7]
MRSEDSNYNSLSLSYANSCDPAIAPIDSGWGTGQWEHNGRPLTKASRVHRWNLTRAGHAHTSPGCTSRTPERSIFKDGMMPWCVVRGVWCVVSVNAYRHPWAVGCDVCSSRRLRRHAYTRRSLIHTVTCCRLMACNMRENTCTWLGPP